MNVYEIAELRQELIRAGHSDWTVTDDTGAYHARRTYRITAPGDQDDIMLHQNHSGAWFAILTPDPVPDPEKYTPAIARNPVAALQDAMHLMNQPPGASPDAKGIMYAI